MLLWSIHGQRVRRITMRMEETTVALVEVSSKVGLVEFCDV